TRRIRLPARAAATQRRAARRTGHPKPRPPKSGFSGASASSLALPDCYNRRYNRVGMSIEADRSRMTVDELAARFRGQMIPLTSKFSYFCTLPVAEEDLRQYLHDPIAALSPNLLTILPQMYIILAPYLEKAGAPPGPR